MATTLSQHSGIGLSLALKLIGALAILGILLVNSTAGAIGYSGRETAWRLYDESVLTTKLSDEQFSVAAVHQSEITETDVHFVGVLTAIEGSSMPGAVQTRTIHVQEVLDGPNLSDNILVKWQAILACSEAAISSGMKVGDVVEVKGNWGFSDTQDVWLCGPGQEWGAAYYMRPARRPEAITDLTATTGVYPGDITLQWTAPRDADGEGAVAAYTVRYWSWEISAEEWRFATDVEGEPIPLAAGTVQTMTINLKPRHRYYFAIKSTGAADLSAPISNSSFAWAAGYLISDINSDLTYTPESILGYEVTIVATAARTDDWTLRLGDLEEIIESVSLFKDLKEISFKLADKGGWAALSVYVKAVAMGAAAEIVLDLRSQVLWGLHPLEDGDYTLLMLDPNAPLLEPGVPYVIKGVIREKALRPPLTSFYYLEVTDASKIEKQFPTPTDPHFTIPGDYTFRYWVNVKLNEVTSLGDNVCTIGLVSERYSLNGNDYIRIRLMEGNESALITRVAYDVPAPTLGSLVLACGTKRSTPNVYDGWQPISNYLNTTEANGNVTLLRGTTALIARHEYLDKTKLVVKTGSPVDLHIWDDQENHIGAIYDWQGATTGYENQLVDAEHIPGTNENGEVILVNNPTSSIYYLSVQGKDRGVYTETIHILDPSGAQTYFHSLPDQPTFDGKYDQIDFTEIPAPPDGLTFQLTQSSTTLDWIENAEDDLLGYNVYRSRQRNGIYQKLNSTPLATSTFTDYEVGTDCACYYYVTALDTSHNESGYRTPLVSHHLLHLPLMLRSPQ